MTATSLSPPSLFDLAERCFEELVAELRRYALDVPASLRLVPAEGMLTFYDLGSGLIHMALPDASTPLGRLQATVLGAYLGCSRAEDVEALFRGFVPRLVAHELGHMLRHRYGRFGADLWQEEQVANRFATALTLRRSAPGERAATLERLRKALDTLAAHVPVPGAAALTYEDVLCGLAASGMTTDATHRNLEVTRAILAIGRRQALVELAVARPSEETTRHLEDRERMIQQINSEYATDFARYMHYHVGWMYLDLLHERNEYIDDLARTCLGVTQETLAPTPSRAPVTDAAVRAAFRAADELEATSAVAARWFHKRYRELLWTRLEQAADERLALLRRESSFFLESFEGDADALASLARVAPEALRPLFPPALAASTSSLAETAAALPEGTDARLYEHARGAPDEAAERTLERLELLERTEVFRGVPATSLLELVPLLSRLHVAAGEVLMWKGDRTADVFFVSKGTFEVASEEEGASVLLGRGEVLGELAYFTRAPRGATVRARVDSECFVVRDADLTRFAFRHPSMVMHMARAIARRFTGR